MKRIKLVLVIATFLLLPFFSHAQVGSSKLAQITSENPAPISSNNTKLPNPIKGVDTIYDFVRVVLENIVLPIGSVVVVIMIIYSGFLFVTARGNDSKISKAKEVFLYVVIGTAILFGAVAISAVIKGTLCQIASSLPGCSSGSPLNSQTPTGLPPVQ